MLTLHAGMRVHLALGATDMRKGFDGLAAQVQTVLKADPFSGHLFLFRGRRGDLLKALWWDGQGLVLLAKRLEKGRFIWPTIAREGALTLTTAQLAMLLEGLDWWTTVEAARWTPGRPARGRRFGDRPFPRIGRAVNSAWKAVRLNLPESWPPASD